MELNFDVRSHLEHNGGVFQDVGALFVSTAKTDGSYQTLLTTYVNCEVLIPHGFVMKEVGARLIDPFIDDDGGVPFDVIVSAAVGDIAFLIEARAFCRDTLGLATGMSFIEKCDDGTLDFDRVGFRAAVSGKRVLVLNDRISGGNTTRTVCARVEAAGGTVVGVTSVSAGNSIDAEMLQVPWFETMCPIDVTPVLLENVTDDMRQLPIVCNIGHGQEFLDEQGGWPAGFVRYDEHSNTLTDLQFHP